MKRKYGVMLIAAVMTVFVGAGIVSAKSDINQNYKTESVTIAQAETHDGALYMAGQSLTIAGTVKGDVYCATQSVVITGTVNGDVICAAQNVQIDGTVTGDVRVATQSASFGGTVQGTVTTFAQSVDITKEAVIGRDFNGAAGTVIVAGNVGRDVLTSSGMITVNGTVGRDIGGEYGQVTVASGSAVAGALRYTSDTDASVAKGTVKGEVVRTAPVEREVTNDRNSMLGAAFYFFISMLVVALVIALLAPRLVHAVAGNGVSQLLPSLLVGFFFVFGAPFILVLLAMTVVGIPLAGLVFFAWLVVLLLSGPAFGYYIGRVIMRRNTLNPLLIMLVGSSALLLSYFIPILNIFTLLATVTVGTGMIVLTISQRYQKPSYKLKKESL